MTAEINAGKRKCPFCGKEIIIKEDKQMWYQGKYYHNECYLQFSEKHLKINGKQLISDKAALLNYVSQIFDSDYLNQKFSIDLVNLLSKNFTYQGILASLDYYQNVKKQKLTSEYGISTVNFIYNEARKYYQQLYENKEKLNNQTIENNHQIIYIKLSQDTYKKEINMDDIFKE